tara:strand:- start:149 stop:505 length:357 start_codon:yes stop_codon:yes gene_type:complete
VVEASCHCGAVRFTLDPAPADVTECNCSICRRYGVLWAYYRQDQVRFAPGSAATATYMCNGQTQHFHRCPSCGCVTHWAPLDPQRTDIGINARLLEPAILSQAQLHHLDGAVTDQYLD